MKQKGTQLLGFLLAGALVLLTACAPSAAPQTPSKEETTTQLPSGQPTGKPSISKEEPSLSIPQNSSQIKEESSGKKETTNPPLGKTTTQTKKNPATSVLPSPHQTTKLPTTTLKPTTQSSQMTNIHQLKPGVEYYGLGKQLFKLRSSDSAFTKIQGAYFDGTNYYIAFLRKLDGGYEEVRIAVTDQNGNRLRESLPLPLDHANNITYHPGLDRLVVTHCSSPDGHYYRYSLVDPHTLTITKTEDKAQPFFAIAYSPQKKRYASGRWSGETLDFWDENMNHLFSKNVQTPQSLSQGVFCDSQGVYFIRSAQNGVGDEIRIYDWEGNLTQVIPISVYGYEPECLNIVGDTVYVVADDWRGNAVVFSLNFQEM